MPKQTSTGMRSTASTPNTSTKKYFRDAIWAKTAGLRYGPARANELAQAKSEAREERGERRIVTTGRAAGVVATGTAAALIVGPAVYTHREDVKRGNQEAAPIEKVVDKTMKGAAGVMINAYHADPAEFQIVPGTGIAQHYEALEANGDGTTAAIVVPVADGKDPQAKHTIYATWIGESPTVDQTGLGSNEFLTQGAQASQVAAALGVNTAPSFIGGDGIPQPQSYQAETDGDLAASTVDPEAGLTPLYEANQVKTNAGIQPPLGPLSGASESLIAAAASSQSMLGGNQG